MCILVFVSDLLRFPLGICRERKMRINRCLLFVERENRRWGEEGMGGISGNWNGGREQLKPLNDLFVLPNLSIRQK